MWTLNVFWWINAVNGADVFSADENHCSPTSVPVLVFGVLAADYMMVEGELAFEYGCAFFGDSCFCETSNLRFDVCQFLLHGFNLVTNRQCIS